MGFRGRGCSTCQRGLGISFTGGLGLCVCGEGGRHDGVKHGWRQPHHSPITRRLWDVKEKYENNKSREGLFKRSPSEQLLFILVCLRNKLIKAETLRPDFNKAKINNFLGVLERIPA